MSYLFWEAKIGIIEWKSQLKGVSFALTQPNNYMITCVKLT